MPVITTIARVSDGLPLAASCDDEKEGNLDTYKNQAKRIFKQLNHSSPARCTYESGSYTFLYLISQGVCYLTLIEKNYPKRLAFSYLEELSKEFDNLYGREVESAQRPYAFIKFDTFIQRTKKLYMDSRNERNLQKLNDDLGEVHRIMSKSIQDVLERGEKLDTVTEMSNTLSAESRKYLKQTKHLNLQALYRKYAPIGVVVIVVLFFLYMRFF